MIDIHKHVHAQKDFIIQARRDLHRIPETAFTEAKTAQYLADKLKELDVDAVPVNFLVGIEGTPVFGTDSLTPLRCLKIIAFLRHALPDKEIIICGGRHQNLGVLHPLVFYAGASGIMTGDYLTTPGMGLEQDLSMIATLGMSVRDKEV